MPINTQISQPARKKVGLLYRLPPGTAAPEREVWPLGGTSYLSRARIQIGSAYFTLLWDPYPALTSASRSKVAPNKIATALLNQPSTVLLKGPLSALSCEI